MFTQESLERLRDKIDLKKVIAPHVQLTESKYFLFGKCPFCRSDGFLMRRDSPTHYHCYGCDALGDAIAFLLHHKRMTFEEACLHLADLFNVDLERVKGPQKKPSEDNDRKLQFLEIFDDICQIKLRPQEAEILIDMIERRTRDKEE